MSRILFCMGATKAGTSWLYRSLHDHAECSLPAVKELHYWDTFDAGARARQVAAFGRRLEGFAAKRAAAEAAGRGWQVANLDRQAEQMTALIAVLEGDRTGDAAYGAFLDGLGQGRLTADLTPSYALLGQETMARLAAFRPGALFCYLVRDPLARLWSHVRMQAERGLSAGEDLAARANGILRRLLKGGHGHILARGDYRAAGARMAALDPRIEVMEELTQPEGWARFAAWAGIAPGTPAQRRIHEGPRVAMQPGLRAPALALLRDQYDWAAERLGRLPDAWRATLDEVTA